MRLKDGVRLDGLQPQILLALMVADHVWWLSGEELTVTSVNDGKHRQDSLHYEGQAVDLRTKDISREKAVFFRDRISEKLGSQYDVILEYDPPHMHIEYDPKE